MAKKIEFTNPETASLFDTDFENDPHVIVGCECNGGRGYEGPLSGIPPMAATALIIQKSNLVKQRKQPKPPKDNKEG